MSIFTDLIALEEDITSQVQQATGDAIGQGSASRRNPDGFDGNRDMSQTDDIFGLQDNAGNSDDNPAGEETPTEGDDSPAEDDGGEGEELVDDEMGEGEDEPLDGDSEDEALEEEKTPQIYQKNKLKNNMILFHNIVSNDINLLTESITAINDASAIGTCNKALANLREVKQFLSDTINEGLAKDPYEKSLRKYVALRRVYDIVIEILNKHFGNVGKK